MRLRFDRLQRTQRRMKIQSFVRLTPQILGLWTCNLGLETCDGIFEAVRSDPYALYRFRSCIRLPLFLDYLFE